MNVNVATALVVSKVLVADGMMTEDERIYLAALMERLKLTEDERKRVIDLEDWDQAEPVIKKLSIDKRREIVAMLADAASADGRISAKEMETIKQVSHAFGLDT